MAQQPQQPPVDADMVAALIHNYLANNLPAHLARAAQPAHHVERDRSPLCPPSKFEGKPGDLNLWIYRIQQELDARQVVDDAQRIRLAQSYLADGPARWHLSLVINNELPTSWGDYLNALRARYAPVFDQDTIRDKIFALRQRGNLKTFIDEFESLASLQQGMDQRTLVRVFIRGCWS